MLRSARFTWWTHWRELADYLLPRRYRWLIAPNQWNRGSPINQKIIDNTATLALRTLASGMMSGITSPSRPWVRLTTVDPTLATQDDVREWLDDTVNRMQQVMAASNYYTAKAVQYVDLGCFGTAPMIIYEDMAPDGKVIRCFNPCAGEYFVAAGRNFTINTLYREFVQTVGQIVEEYGYENCSPQVKAAYDQKGSAIDREIMIAHAIEPNPEYTQGGGPMPESGIPSHFAFREVYWEKGSAQSLVLRVSGFLDQPFSCPRWDTTGNDAYGRSPGMDALGDTKQLQVQQKRKSQAIDKMVNPPMLADAVLKNTPASLLPGDITYLPGSKEGVGFKPIFQVNAPIEELSKDMAEAQARIKTTFFSDLFLMISQLDTVRTATEIDARKEEQLMQLGPVLERFNSEGLDPDIRRIYSIMKRNGMLAPPPDSLHGVALKTEYISSLADQQRASITTSIERLFAFIGSIQGVVSDAIDKIDTDASIDAYGEALRVPAKLLRSGRALAAVRDNRAQHNAQVAAQQQTQQAVTAAQNLSQTDVGGGQSALAAILSGGAPSGAQGGAP